MEEILRILPSHIRTYINQLTEEQKKELEEIRIRVGRPIEIIAEGKPYFLPYVAKSDDSQKLLNKMSNYSIYTLEEELRRGYITIPGGHRIGLAGKVILENGSVKAIRDISSFNIRVAREKVGIANHLIPQIYDDGWLHTMIIGPPQTGKTTLLRDIGRIISQGWRNIPSSKVGIIDERSEIAGSVHGVPQLTFGPRVDVLDACPKAEGMMMMIRSMSPEVLIVDEIGRKEDCEAVLEAVNAGITLIITTHGHSLTEVSKRPILRPVLETGIFERFIELGRSEGPGTVVAVKDKQGRELRCMERVK